MSTSASSRATAIAPVAPAAASLRLATAMSRVLSSGLLVGGVVALLMALWVLFGLGGLEYYRTPLAVRAYVPSHPMLRPSGPIGQTLGVVGALMMLMPFAYVARKRVRMLRDVGPLKVWLEVHLFCGLVGPILVTFHTSFKFNGIVSAAYWSMVLVMLSGFVGRYLYLRIPRSIRGVELSRAELESRADDLRQELAASSQFEAIRGRLDVFEQVVHPHEPSAFNLLFGELAIGRHVRAFEQELVQAGVPGDLRSRTVAVALQRAMLVRQAIYLQKTKQLFAAWHVFHLPLVYLLLVIVVAHVAVATYLGYVPFRW